MVISSERRKRLTIKIDKRKREIKRDEIGDEWLFKCLKDNVELEGILEDDNKINEYYNRLECNKDEQQKFSNLVTISKNSKAYQDMLNLEKRKLEYFNHLNYLEYKEILESVSKDKKNDKEKNEFIANNLKTVVENYGMGVIMENVKERIKDGVYKKAYDECSGVNKKAFNMYFGIKEEEDFEYFIDFSRVKNSLMGKNIKDAFIENEKCIRVYRIRDGKRNKLKGGGYKTFIEEFMKQNRK